MNESREFVKQMLASQEMDPARREKYRHEVKALLERRLSTVKRVLIALAGAFLLVCAVGFGNALRIATIEHEPVVMRILAIAMVLFCLSVGGILVWTSAKGIVYRRLQPNAIARVFWGFGIIAAICSMVAGTQQAQHAGPLSAFMVAEGLVVLVIAAVYMIANRVEQSELRMRQELLEMRYELAELSEKLAVPGK